MKNHHLIGLISLFVAMGFGSAPLFAATALRSDPRGVEQIQYDRYPDQRRDGNNDRDFRSGPKWRPGQVLPGQFLNRVVPDWEERGLSRPPDGHQWVRVGQQFILVRARDRMIARILNFD